MEKPRWNDRRYNFEAGRQGFTLIELLVTLLVILLIAGMVVSMAAVLRERARRSNTAARMQVILDALTSYGSAGGSPATSLQANLPIGGVVAFASVKEIDDTTLNANVAQPPGFTYWCNLNGSGNWMSMLLTVANYQTDSMAVNNAESVGVFRRLEATVFDVMPPSIAADTSTSQYPIWWPTQWPQTDWTNVIPGPNPPILRFPWGRPGLRIDGTPCDPSVPAGPLAGTPAQQFEELAMSAGVPKHVYEPMSNSWATLGSPITSGNTIWSWTPNSPLQTDWVTLNSATRSDGSAVPTQLLAANLPLPFDLGYLSPLQTIQFLTATGTLSAATGAQDYRTNRNPSAAWNDAWGNPLIVVYAIYQPERYSRTFDGLDRRDLFLREAEKAYQFNRAIYFAIGSAGKNLPPSIPQTWTADQDSVVMQQYWFQIRAVCNAVSWTETSFDNPPWQGTKVSSMTYQGVASTCMLTAPTVVK